jgi:hypothetical protein
MEAPVKVTFAKAWRYADPADPGVVLTYGPGEVDIPEKHAWRAISLGHAALPNKRDDNPTPEVKDEPQPAPKRRGRPRKKAD